MSLLEDRLTKILELKISGKSDEDISKELGLETRVINKYEESLKKSISNYSGLNTGKIARRVGVSPIIIDMAISYYQMSNPLLSRRKVIKTGRSLPETIEEIRRLAAEGLKKEDIAFKLGYSKNTIQVYAYQGNVTELLPQKRLQYQYHATRERRKRNIERINEIISEGITSCKELAEKTGMNYSSIYRYRKLGLINFPTARRGRKTLTGEPAKDLVQRTIDEGAKSMEEIYVRTGLSISTVRDCCRTKKIELTMYSEDGLETDSINPNPNLAGSKRRQNIDELVKKGLTLQEIGGEIGVTRERIRQYILETGQHSEYMKLRIAKKAEASVEKKEGLLQDIRILITKRLEQVAEKEGWAYKKAVEYLNAHKHPHRIATSFESLVELFQRYETAVKSGDKLSLCELSKGILPHYASYAQRILKTVRLEPMWGRKERHITPKEKKEAIKRSLKLRMSPNDIAYFLNIPWYVVAQNQIIYGKRKYRSEILKKSASLMGSKQLTYRLASQIYEAKDLGFNTDEISELYGAPKSIVAYALGHKSEIRPKIVKELKVLYRRGKSNKPYVTKYDKL